MEHDVKVDRWMRLYRVKFFGNVKRCYVVAETFKEVESLVNAYLDKQREIYSDLNEHYEISGIWDIDADIVISRQAT